jgi:formate dehydrogenase iron-sulfur subunit
VTAPYSREFSIIDLALADQRDMSAAERFSNLSEADRTVKTVYRNLIPLTRPKTGEQYAFVVDMDRCSGCKACVSACHSLNGLEEGEMWRSVGTIIGEESPYLQTVTSSCHHCVDPACAAGCPVHAYEKDASTGIVRHLDDQCIGCQYCVLKCPYDVPKYSKTKGIVRKCDMCHSRLAVGEAPACAQACPHQAIRIEIVGGNHIRAAGAALGARMIAGAFPSSYTLPTTKYISAKDSPSRIRSACTDSLRLEDPHWPLIWMLVLTQMSVGVNLVSSFLLLTNNSAPIPALLLSSNLTLIVGLITSVFHLGRPLKAWRAFLGWRRSWMSREILAFTVYATLTALFLFLPRNLALALVTVLAGLGCVFASAMIYVDTRRPGWSAKSVFPSFFGTTLLLGPTLGGAICGWFAPGLVPALATIATIVRTALFSWRFSTLIASRSPIFRLAPRTRPAAIGLFLVSTLFSVLAIFNYAQQGPWWGWIACVSTISGQVLDRWMFFVGTPAPRMPGAFSP